MKRCPKCRRTYTDYEAEKFCLSDGEPLIRDQFDKYAETLFITTKPSIAVLPFVNLSADPENEYFCDGLAGELINNLAKVESMKVAARTSAFWFKGKNAKLSEIGQTLNVESILEGSVIKAGKRVRITVELVSVSEGHCLWAEEYDRQMASIFDIQDEITMAVVDALKVKLLGEEKTAALKRYTDNVEAYEQYLKGRYHFYKHTSEGWQKATEYFEKAIGAEPEYAPAYAGLSSVLAFAWYFGTLHPDEAIPKWKVANSQALEIGGNLEETHIAVGRFRFLYEWNWEEAELEYKRAIEINPDNADAHQQYGLFLASKGWLEEAITKGRRAVELDPLSLLVNLHVGWIYWLANRWDDALGQVQRMIEIESSFYPAYWVMGATYMIRRDYEGAIEAYKKSLDMGGGYHVLSSLGHSYGLSGKRKEALDVINQLLEVRKWHHATAYNIALVYGGLRENDKAFEWLERAYQERNGELVYIKIHTEIGTVGLWGEEFRADPRFSDLLQRMGFRP
jgi:adenylate cyclase